MLALDSLVTDLIFQSGDSLDPEALLTVLGGKDELATRQLIDPDMQDPQFEMEVSPSAPFRRRDERRLLIIDDSVAPMRKDPREELIIPLDLRPAKDKLIEICETIPVRLGRLFALGTWADAVWVVRSYRDLRAISLLRWALDPTTDVQGRRRGNTLTREEFEEKLLAYDKRLDELDDDQIKKLLVGANVEERGELIIVDMLEDDGTWDVRKSVEVEANIAAIDRFSTFVGAKSAEPRATDESTVAPKTEAPEVVAEAATEPVVEVADQPSLRTAQLKDSLLVIFPAARFDLEVAAALGKKDWSAILCAADTIDGRDMDRIYRGEAEFVAPVEFLSEVFLQGSPLSKSQFEDGASLSADGVKTMEVHFPRFGPVVLMARPDGARFVSSKLDASEEILAALA